MTSKTGNIAALPVHGGLSPLPADYWIVADGLVREQLRLRPDDLAAMPPRRYR